MSDTSLTLHDIMELDNEVIKDIKAMTKKKYVEKYHQRKISFIQSRNIWRTYVGEPRKEVTRKEEKDLIEFLFNYYKEKEDIDYTFKGIFNKMQEYRKNVENIDINTITRDDYFYRKFFTDEFGEITIEKINGELLNSFIGNRVKELHPKEKAFNGFIGIFSKVFKYAIKQQYITSDPYHLIDKKRFYKDCDHNTKTGDEKIFTLEEIQVIKDENLKILEKKYDPYAFAILLSIETGMRIGEIPALHWEDIKENSIHIFRQQKYCQGEKENKFVELLYTKDERTHPHNGRFFPMTNNIKELLNNIQSKQKELNIHSEYIFCNKKGEWISKRCLETRVEKCCRKIGYKVTNNHAFRMSLNSNVLIPLGIPVQQRAYILGHSVETNLRHYTYTHTNYLDDIGAVLNKMQ